MKYTTDERKKMSVKAQPSKLVQAMKSESLNLSRSVRRAYRDWNVDGRLARLDDWFDRSRKAGPDGDSYDHTETVNDYYDLCSEFMRFGWNESLHFAPLKPKETLEEAIVNHQRMMIKQLRLQEGMRVVDIGCGLGGPMRRVARESGANVACLNNNKHQLEDARRRNLNAGLDHKAEYIECNFMDMSTIEANSFDAGYAIESTCHAPDKKRAFAEIIRVLKPGALFWGQEMCMTEKFDPDNSGHRAVKEKLMQGIALNDIATFPEVDRALESIGFQIIEARDWDVKDGSGTPWWQPMEGQSGTLRNAFRRTPLGRKAIIASLRLAETFRFFPKGTAAVVHFMSRTAEAYVAGGRMGIFSPLYCFLARKPD
ncbi:MAG: class I SAM-dependent methyltransferase [Gammaproteobacteria bacterium]|nr:class I SAM-dependent methyltransferase [Gammaproteobacteria bacterium]